MDARLVAFLVWLEERAAGYGGMLRTEVQQIAKAYAQVLAEVKHGRSDH
jgi:hypothetical protein